MLINIDGTPIEKIVNKIKKKQSLTKTEWTLFAAEGDLREVLKAVVAELLAK